MRRILGLALYGPMAASNRYRLGQYVTGLADHGIELDVRALLGDLYLRRTFGGGSLPVVAMLAAGWERLGDLRSQRSHDALMLQYELFPLMPSWVEGAMLRRPYLYDIDDALYLKYRLGRLRALAPLLGNKFDVLIQAASAITAGSRVLANYSTQHNPNTTLLPTVVDTDRYLPVRHKRSDEFVVGWIGSPSTAPYLSALFEPLSALGREGPVRLVVIGGRAPPIPGITINGRPWSESTEIELINSFDVGVMPLPDNEWARGKCAFKIVQYMACGVPVIASPVGANCDVVLPETGILARSAADWLGAFRLIRDDPIAAARMGEAGRARIEEHYSLSRNLPVLAGVIHTVVDRK